MYYMYKFAVAISWFASRFRLSILREQQFSECETIQSRKSAATTVAVSDLRNNCHFYNIFLYL